MNKIHYLNTIADTAEKYIGIKEDDGKNKSKDGMIEFFQSYIDKAERESWCMAFVQRVLQQVELKTGELNPLYKSENCNAVFESSPKLILKEKEELLRGMIAVFRWWTRFDDGSYFPTTSGHTGIVSSVQYKNNKPFEFSCVEGNTTSFDLNTKEKVEGVFRKKRKYELEGPAAKSGKKILLLRGFIDPSKAI